MAVTDEEEHMAMNYDASLTAQRAMFITWEWA